MLSPEDIEKFIPEYPDSNNEKFGYELMKKKEFNDLKLGRSEGEKEPGELLDSQKFMKRFFSPNTPYDNALIFHLMGTGKCVHPDTKIPTSKGIIRAEDIWKRFAVGAAHKNDESWATTQEKILVSSYDEKRRELVDRSIKNLFRQLVTENLVCITLENDSKIVITRKHKLFNGKIWFNNFRIGDDIAIPDKDVLLFSRIKKLDNIPYQGYVYDFEVEEHHNYVANNILCHNTCVSSAVVENFKSEEVSGKPHKPALVFVKSKALEKTYANDISKICTKDVYTAKVKTAEAKKEGFSMTEEAKSQRIAKSIKQVYSIVTYETFLKKLEPDEILKQKFSNRVIIIDEAHTLRIQPAKKKKAVSSKPGKPDIVDLSDEDPAYDQNEDAENLEGDLPAAQSVTLYKQMHHFLHVVENCRILLLTGTPIWDRTSEIASLMNLILDLDNQLPTGNKFNKEFFDSAGKLKDGSKAILMDKFRGKVSFLRQMVTTAKREEQGTKEPWLNYIKVFPCAMSDFQAKYAEEAKNKLEITTVKSKGVQRQRKTKGGAVRRLERYATNIVIPLFDKSGKVTGGTYDKKTFEKFALITIARPNNKGYVKKYQITDVKLKTELKNNLANYSAKFAAMIEQIKKHPDEVTFIYNESVSGPGGVLMFAICLELHGFDWIKTAGDIGKTSNRKRFAVISGDSQTTSGAEQIQKLLESHNKPDNCYGDRLQVIIGSEKVALGFTVKHVRRVYITTPSWNIPSIDQALARGFRFGSHNALKEEERYINIYRLVSVEKGKYAKGAGFPANIGFSSKKTSDIEIYELAENKEYKNTQIYRILKEASFDCAINYKRNVLPEDAADTKECDYMQCNYICDSFPSDAIKKGKVYDYYIKSEDIDRTNYDLFYAGEKIKEYKNGIIDLFNRYFSLKFSDLQRLLDVENSETFILLQSINSIIENRILIRNRYGFLCYLKEQDNMLFLDNSTSEKPNYSETTYIENPLITEKTAMDDLIEIFELQDDKSLIKEFCGDPSDDNFNKFSYKTKIILLEATETAEKPSGVSETVLRNMVNKINIMSDGVKVHVLYTDEYKGVSYDIGAKKIKVTGLMRFYNEEEQRWEYVKNRKTEEKYVEEINSSKTKHYVESKNKYSGWVSSVDKIFRVVSKDGRGRNCKTTNAEDIIKVFLEIGYLPKAPKEYRHIEKEDLITRIQAKYAKAGDLKDKEEPYLRNMLYLIDLKKEEKCEELKKWFKENNLLKED